MADELYALRYSRYKDVPIIVDGEEEFYMLREPIEVVERDDDILHTVVDGDRIDLLAYRYLGDARHWWVIADYNDIQFPLALTTGTVLRIPSMETLHMHILK